MSNRLTEIEIALQRIAEGARARGDDIEYTRYHEDQEHLLQLRHALAMVDKVHSTLVEEIQRFETPKQQPRLKSADPTPKTNSSKPQEEIPGFLSQGPKV
jgi:hypothetical protein